MTPEWRAWYTDDRTFDSGDLDWADLPATGVLGVAMLVDASTDPPLKKRVDGGDWYWLEGDRVRCSETTWGGYVTPPAVSRRLLKRGAAVSDAAFAAVQTEMRVAFR